MILKKVVNLNGLKTGKKKISFNFVLALVFVFITFAMVFDPEKYINVSLTALLVFATVILPAIFPFLIFSKFLTKFGVVDFFSRIITPITRFLFKTNGVGAYVFTISVISGYPVGAKITSDLFEEGRIDRANAIKIMTFSACSGPMFILGTVGIGMFLSATAGYIMLVSHILGAILNGVLYRNIFKGENKLEKIKSPQLSDDEFLSKTALSSANSMMIVGTYILLFFVIIEFFTSLFALTPGVLSVLLSGFLEITRACQELSILNISLCLKTVLATFIITFGGLSTLVQSMAFLKKMKFPTTFLILLKLTHALFSTIICFLLLLIFKV
jgi:sporulation integral membrane protein YlbJ